MNAINKTAYTLAITERAEFALELARLTIDLREARAETEGYVAALDQHNSAVKAEVEERCAKATTDLAVMTAERDVLKRKLERLMEQEVSAQGELDDIRARDIGAHVEISRLRAALALSAMSE